MLWPQICCTQYQVGVYVHPEAPRSWFGKTLCIEAVPYTTKDARIGRISKCRIKISLENPACLPNPP